MKEWMCNICRERERERERERDYDIPKHEDGHQHHKQLVVTNDV